METHTQLMNFRDLGGLKTDCGKTVRRGRLLRAALPVGLTESDIAALRALDLRVIFDLRTLGEVAALPADEIAGVTYTHIDIMGENSSHSADPRFWMELFHKNPLGVEEEFAKTYREFATSPTALAGYSAFLKACAARENGAVLFHCAAGKDRTGFAAAIILKILNVPEEEIFADYMKTRAYQEQVNDFYVARAKKRGFSDEQIKSMGEIFGVKESYLQAAYAAAEDAFGSFENYLAHGLGLDGEEISKLREFYLE